MIMKTNLNFSVDKENKKIYVEREFASPVPTVWSAWTQQEILDQWWAPKPWKAQTKYLDFREGGYWLYAMVGPEGEEHFARADYKSVLNQKSFSGLDRFCNSEGIVINELPQNYWEVKFIDHQDSTLVNIELTFDSLEDLEKTLEMGFKEGFIAALENLDEVLENQKIEYVI